MGSDSYFHVIYILFLAQLLYNKYVDLLIIADIFLRNNLLT